MEETKRGNVFLTFQSSEYVFEKPEFKEKSGRPYISFGKDNQYPNRLLELFNNSGKHGAIVSGKANYVSGKGFTVNETAANAADIALAKSWLNLANPYGESWNDLLEKIALDIEIYNGAYIQVIYNKITRKPVSYYHIDFNRVRTNKGGSEFYVSDEWEKSNPKYETYQGYNPNRQDESQILFVRVYRPGSPTYPLPFYIPGLRWIEIDVGIANFNLSAINNDMAVSKIFNMNGNIPDTQEERDDIEKDFKKKYQGAKKAGGWVLAFNDSKENELTAIDISETNLPERFEQLNKTAQQEIFTAHNVTSPMLFGIKTEGQLGGRTELLDAYELFKNTYVNNRQQFIERLINILATQTGITAPITIMPTEAIGKQLSEQTLLQICDKNELREVQGLKPMEVPSITESSRTLDALNTLSPLVATKVLNTMTDNEVRALVGLVPTEGGNSINPVSLMESFSDEKDEKDALVFAQFGEDRSSYVRVKSKEVQFSSDMDCLDADNKAYTDAFASGVTATIDNIKGEILGVLKSNPGVDAQAIAEALKVDVDLVENSLKSLLNSEALEVTESENGEKTYKPTAKGSDIIKNDAPESIDIFIRYSYYGPEDDKNRPFCKKVLSLNRVYSRADIEKISQKLGYSVWERRGGYYHNPKTGVTTKYCRHFWQQELMIKKAE